MSTQTERHTVPLDNLTRLADALMMHSPTVGDVIGEEDERRLHARFDELTEEIVGPMSQENYLRLAVVLMLRHGLKLS